MLFAIFTFVLIAVNTRRLEKGPNYTDNCTIRVNQTSYTLRDIEGGYRLELMANDYLNFTLCKPINENTTRATFVERTTYDKKRQISNGNFSDMTAIASPTSLLMIRNTTHLCSPN